MNKQFVQYQSANSSWLSCISSVSLIAPFPSEPSVPLQKESNRHNASVLLSQLLIQKYLVVALSY